MHMSKNKLVACRFDDELYNKINKNVIPNSDLIRTAVIQYLNNTPTEVIMESDEDDLYNKVYNNLYNIEVVPLKQEIKYLNCTVVDLKDDKKWLMTQNNALLLAKMPILGRIKMKLLQRLNRESSRSN